ncbi:MAG: AAA family ATPase [Saprospiraceae bacterium]|nr:AAA family ATPase [Saprospiraceae bacterium]
MNANSFYVAATNQHVGKTTSTLGLVSALKQRGINMGYCKPVGQRYLDLDNIRVDKDTLLFADLLGFKIEPALHSPVILGRGATTSYLDDPTKFDFRSEIMHAAQQLWQSHECVIFEGTGHPGVGSVVDLSNADVAKMVKAPVIMIVEGGIGSTIDRLNVSLAMFREQNIPMVGVIVNKVREDKLDKVRTYVGKKLAHMGLNLLGVLPYDESLAFPIISTISEAVSGSVVLNAHQIERKVEDIMPGSLIDSKRFIQAKNVLLVAGADRVGEALAKADLLIKVNNIPKFPIAGIVATGEGDIGEESMEFLKEHQIPLIRTHLDTYGSVMKISKIEVKINLNTPWKINRAIDLITTHIDLDQIMDVSGK